MKLQTSITYCRGKFPKTKKKIKPTFGPPGDDVPQVGDFVGGVRLRYVHAGAFPQPEPIQQNPDGPLALVLLQIPSWHFAVQALDGGHPLRGAAIRQHGRVDDVRRFFHHVAAGISSD